jgi:hypothetical protein
MFRTCEIMQTCMDLLVWIPTNFISRKSSSMFILRMFICMQVLEARRGWAPVFTFDQHKDFIYSLAVSQGCKSANPSRSRSRSRYFNLHNDSIQSTATCLGLQHELFRVPWANSVLCFVITPTCTPTRVMLLHQYESCSYTNMSYVLHQHEYTSHASTRTSYRRSRLAVCFSGAGDGMLLVHSLVDGSVKYGLGANRAAVRCIGLASDALLASGDDGKVLIYNF